VLEVGSAHALVKLLGISSFDLVLDEAIQEFLVSEIVFRSLAEPQLE
jgi:hypothetical protein